MNALLATKSAIGQRNRYLRRKHAGLCGRCGKCPPAPNRTACSTCCEIANKTQKKIWPVRKRNFTQAVLNAYGRKCACCGITEPLFLEVDHINGGGRKHLREELRLGHGGPMGFYAWLVKNNFPLGFQILCSNCNKGRYRNGGICPHKAVQP